MRKIIIVSAQAYGLEAAGLFQRTRREKIAAARQLAMYLLREHTKLSLCEIGGVFSMDHGTVIHSLRRVKDRMETEPEFRRMTQQLSTRFENAAKVEAT